jgi:DNA-binding response OmpR family regulator
MNPASSEPPFSRPGASHVHAIYEFGGYRLDAARRQVRSADGAALDITAKAFDALTYLVRIRIGSSHAAS